MDNKLKILLLVAEPLRCDDGGGNTAINFFNGMDAEFAQIYTSELLPQNDFCSKYYRITDSEVIRNFFSRKPVGKMLTESDFKPQEAEEPQNGGKSFFNTIKTLRLNCFLTAKDIIWYYSNYKTAKLEKFIEDFNPDVIYAPCYASPFQLALTRYVKKLTGKKILTWSADDNYSLKQFSFSPFFWINRFWHRAALRKTYPYYDAFYSISEEEAREIEPIVGQKIGILRKGIDLTDFEKPKSSVNSPIKMIYAGGIYIQRWKTLEKIGKAIKEINAGGKKMQLDVYTQNTPTKKQFSALNDGENIFLHKAVNAATLKNLYNQSDIALHCESFALKNRLITRLSFSTKIVDCLSSGCAVMAVAHKSQAGLKYLRQNDAAICITNLKNIKTELEKLANNPNLILDYSKKASVCGIANHNKQKIQEQLFGELKKLV